MKDIIIINGPNLNLLGNRQNKIYGDTSYSQLCVILKNYAKNQNLNIEIFQSNYEGQIVEWLHNYSEYKGIIINPAAFSHYSIAILDALLAIEDKPKIEVHLSNIYKREQFRRNSVISQGVDGVISGFGVNGYISAINILKEIFINEKKI
jgi:3-dehydroquinate dehydratase-2